MNQTRYTAEIVFARFGREAGKAEIMKACGHVFRSEAIEAICDWIDYFADMAEGADR